MCPLCMATVELMVAGAASIAGASALMVKRLWGCEQPLDESTDGPDQRRIDHDIEAAGSSESRLAN
jgi:hypothetical protein